MYDKVIYHKSGANLSCFTHELSSILKIKLSKAQAHHANALGLSNYNHLVSKLKSEDADVGIGFSAYIEKLTETLKAKHQITLSEDQVSELEVALSVDAQKILDGTTFLGFMRFSLINSNQPSPLISKDEIACCLDDDLYLNDIDKLLVNYWSSPFDYKETLFSIIHSVLGRLRKRMKGCQAELGQKSAWAVNKYSKESELEAYRKAVLTSVSINVSHIYYMPIAAYREDDLFAFVRLGSSSMTNDIRSLNLNEREILFGLGASKIHDCCHCFADETDATSYFWSSQRMIDSRLMENIDFSTSVLVVENEDELKLTPELTWHSQDIYFSFGKYDDHYDLPNFPNAIHSKVFPQDQDNDDFTRTGIFAYPIAKVGKDFSKEQLDGLSKILREGVEVSEHNNVVLGEPCKLMDSIYDNDDEWVKLLAKIIGAVFEADPSQYAVFSNSKEGILSILTKGNAYSPLGREYELIGMESRTEIWNEDGALSCDRNFNDLLEPVIAMLPKKNKTKILDTYFNNFGGEGHARWSFTDYMEDFHFDEVIPPYPRTVESCKQIIDELPFDKCRNVYAISCDRGEQDDPLLIVGFDARGNQVLNLTYYSFVANYSNDYWDKQEMFFKGIRKAIGGYFYHYSNEASVPYTGYSIALSTQFNETELVTNYFSGSAKDNEFGPIDLYDIWIQIPNGMSLSTLDSILRNELSVLEYDRVNATFLKNAVGFEELINSPLVIRDYDKQDYRWIKAFSTEELNPYKDNAIAKACLSNGVCIYQINDAGGVIDEMKSMRPQEMMKSINYYQSFGELDGKSLISNQIALNLLNGKIASNERVELTNLVSDLQTVGVTLHKDNAKKYGLANAIAHEVKTLPVLDLCELFALLCKRA